MDSKPFSTNIDSLRERYVNKCQIRMKIYEQLLEKCYIRVKNAAENDNTYFLYSIPDFILGMPSYNLAYCAAYIIFDLQKNGFTAKFFNPNVIFITWSYEQPSYLLENNNRTISFQQTKLLMPPTTNTSKIIEIPKPKYRSIYDYKPTGNFIK